MRSKSGMHIITEADPVSGALFARNAYNTEFGGRVAFFNCDASLRTVTGDRTEFIGRNGTLDAPAALRRSRLSGKVGAGLDACAAIQAPFDLLPGQEREIVFVLGVGGRRNADASSLVQKHRTPAPRMKRWPPCTPTGRNPGRVCIKRRSGTGRDRQRLADVPDHRLPHLGAQRLLPVGRRVRLPRPAAGCDGHHPYATAAAARPAAAVRRAPVP
jgi:hypothetical protein